MNAPGESSPHGSTSPTAGRVNPSHSPAAPLLVWLVIQMAVLVLAAQRVPLSARWPHESERLAVHEMLVAQIAVSALLFPWLLRDRITTILVAASGILFLYLAAFLAGVDHVRVTLVAGQVVGWIVGLAMWRPLLAQWRATMIGVGMATCVSLGSALLVYLRADAAKEPASWTVHLGPIMSALAQLHSASLASWAFVIVLLITSILALLQARRVDRQVIHKVLHNP